MVKISSTALSLLLVFFTSNHDVKQRTTTLAFAPSSPQFMNANRQGKFLQPFQTAPYEYQHALRQPTHTSRLFMSSSSSTSPEAPSMRVAELKKELESYGISTKTFLEKSELVEAVEKARAEGKTPTASSSPTESSSSQSESSSSSSSDSESREEKLIKEMEKCKATKASELKAELQSYGINTQSFFEKSEFVKACAEARVDGATKQSNTGAASASSSGENYAEYTEVEVLTDDDAGPRKKSQEQTQGQGGSPSGAGGMGGMGGMGGIADMMSGMGGMGGMGGIADMMKNMGGMGGMGAPPGAGAGGNPFGGGMPGGMPGGDQMKKAQEMMSNPKVMEIIMKAQKNPKIMKAVQECMGNPMAFSKYQNDPEVGELIRELQKYV